MSKTGTPVTPYDRILKGEFSAKLPREDVDEPLELKYSRYEHNREQTRLKNRYALMPQIDLTSYSCSALIDYLDLRLTFNEEQHFSKVQELLKPICVTPAHPKRKPQVLGPEGEKDYSGTEFRARIQEAKLPKLVAFFDEPSNKARLAEEPRICEVEVSVDLRPKAGGSRDARQLMVGLMTLHYLPPEGMVTDRYSTIRVLKKMAPGGFGGFKSSYRRNVDWLDQTFWKLDDGSRSTTRSHYIYNFIKVDRTIAVGRKNGDATVRIMDKLSDERNNKTGKFTELPENKRKARIEVTLREQEVIKLHIDTLSQLHTFDFTKLRRKYFTFYLPTLPKLSAKKNFKDGISAWLAHFRIEVFLKIGMAHYQRDQKREVHRIRHEQKTQKDAGEWVPKKTQVSRVSSGWTTDLLAFTSLHKKFENALRNLTVKNRQIPPTSA